MKMHPVGIVAVLLLVSTEILGYPPQERLMPDESPVAEDAVEHKDSVASASEVGEEYDDSDMYMEPDETEVDPRHEVGTSTSKGDEEEREAETSTIRGDEVDHEEVATEAPATGNDEKPAATEKPETSADQEAKNTEDATRFVEVTDGGLQTDSQNFFPSFAELFANHRLPFTEQQQRFRPNRFLGYYQRDRNYQAAASDTKDQHSLLGSGNFGVIRGGTYYPEDKENDEYSVDESLYNPYYHGARGRTQYYRNPKPQPIRGGDFFANFRDFADITAPPKSSFSHLSVVYANKNGSTAAGRVTEPRNIIETLRMLEEQEERSDAEEGDTFSTEETPRKKQSKGKRKLMKMKQYEEDKARRSRMSVEPLLALS